MGSGRRAVRYSLSSSAELLAVKSSSLPACFLPSLRFLPLSAATLPFCRLVVAPLRDWTGLLHSSSSAVVDTVHEPLKVQRGGLESAPSLSSDSTILPREPLTPRPSEGLFLRAIFSSSSLLSLSSSPDSLFTSRSTCAESLLLEEEATGASFAGRLAGTCA